MAEKLGIAQDSINNISERYGAFHIIEKKIKKNQIQIKINRKEPRSKDIKMSVNIWQKKITTRSWALQNQLHLKK